MPLSMPFCPRVPPRFPRPGQKGWGAPGRSGKAELLLQEMQTALESELGLAPKPRK